MIDIMEQAIKTRKLLAVKANYNHEALFFYALNISDNFFFGVEEFDFELDGYQIRKIDDISESLIIDNFSAKINVEEGLLEQIIDFKIDLTSYETIFNYLYNKGNIISIEREYDDEDNFFVIGKIVKVTEQSVWFKDFNVEGIWNDEINIIPFDIITTIRFNSKYIKVWQKYISEVKL